MNKKFEEPMINVYNFNSQMVATDALSPGYEGNEGSGTMQLQEFYHSNYITVDGGLDENIPL